MTPTRTATAPMPAGTIHCSSSGFLRANVWSSMRKFYLNRLRKGNRGRSHKYSAAGLENKRGCCRTKSHENMRLLRQYKQWSPKDSEIAAQARPLRICQIELRLEGQNRLGVVAQELFFRDRGQKLFLVAKLQRRPTCHTGFERTQTSMFGGKRQQEFRQVRARSDQAHVPTQNIQQLRQFIQLTATKEFPHWGNSGVAAARYTGSGILRVVEHGAKF